MLYNILMLIDFSRLQSYVDIIIGGILLVILVKIGVITKIMDLIKNNRELLEKHNIELRAEITRLGVEISELRAHIKFLTRELDVRKLMSEEDVKTISGLKEEIEELQEKLNEARLDRNKVYEKIGRGDG